ncbi:MAG: hypothetical protein QE263_06820 [Vampirovibrionales bacterium]|nr:hypothetical protein [Vampirovibrionales bacterium]
MNFSAIGRIQYVNSSGKRIKKPKNLNAEGVKFSLSKVLGLDIKLHSFEMVSSDDDTIVWDNMQTLVNQEFSPKLSQPNLPEEKKKILLKKQAAAMAKAWKAFVAMATETLTVELRDDGTIDNPPLDPNAGRDNQGHLIFR